MESEVEFIGLVIGTRGYCGRGDCRITDGKTEYLVQCDDCVPGRLVRVNGTITDFGKMLVAPKEMGELSGEEENEGLAKVEKAAGEGVRISDDIKICDDETAMKMRDSMIVVLRKLMAASKLGRFIMLKFHHDADGISGAFALTSFLRCRTYQQNSAVYSARDAVRDLGTLHNENRPLIILLDFGANKESAEGIRLLRAAGIEVVIIDHHPPDMETLELADVALSPWQFLDEEKASRYVAGYLCSEIAGMAGKEMSGYARIACAGDKSEIIEVGDEDRKKALVLDYLAANASFGNNLEFYKSTLNNDELFRSLWLQADEKISSAAARLLGGAKPKDANGIRTYVFDLDRVVIPKEFPNRSKVATRLFETLNKEGDPLVVFGLGDRIIIMRANAEAIEKGADLNALIPKVRESMGDFILGGGGHSRAAALRVREGYAKTVVDELIRLLG